MIRIRRKWMTYTYFDRNPELQQGMSHLFSFAYLDKPLFTRIPFNTMVVDIHNEQFISQWSASTRTKVNKAIRENLVVDRGQYLLPDILKLFSYTARAKSLRGYPVSHFEAYDHIECSAIVVDGVMICGHVWLLDPDEKRALLYVNATNRHNMDDDLSLTGRANYFLLWQDGLHLRDMGIEKMDLMGYEESSAHKSLRGVSQWKAGTHGRKEELYQYYPTWFYVLRKFRNMLMG